MSNKAQLQINNTELSTLIETLRGKAAGGDTSVELQEKTVTPTTAIQQVQPDTGYDGLSKVTVNAMPTATQATPSITVSSAGKITATSTQSAGYVAAGTKTATKQLTTQAAQTITPGTSNKTIASGRYLTGTQTIKGDANLKAANIAKGKSIFSVTGTYTSDATATAANIVEGKTAYVNGTKLTGTNPYEKTATDTEVNSQATKLAELKTILQGKAAGNGGESGSGSFVGVDVTVKTQKNPMTTTKYVSKIVSSSIGTDGLNISQQTTNFVYMNIIPPAVVGTLIFIKTANNPSSCRVNGDLELIDFVSSSHAIVRVAADGEIDNSVTRTINFS